MFNGIRYRLGLPVNSVLDWKTYEFGYEYDFVVKNWGFVGFISRPSTPTSTSSSPARSPRSSRTRAARFRRSAASRASTSCRTSRSPARSPRFKIPDSIDSRYNAHYVDVDFYGTVNFTNNVGVKGGYRSRDVGYLIKADTGAFTLKGIYFGAVVRY